LLKVRFAFFILLGPQEASVIDELACLARRLALLKTVMKIAVARVDLSARL
jgi:hypothetical protein